MTFSVSIDGPRIKATFSRDTLGGAIDQARELVGRGVITITDPRHLAAFDDERFDRYGLSRADPAAGDSARHSGDYGLYGVFEQRLYRVKGDDDRGVGMFARATYSPSDRNLISFYADGGIELIGLSEQRPHDKFGIAAGYARVSNAVRALDGDFQRVYSVGATPRPW